MTLVYFSGKNQRQSLSVFPEAVRGLRNQNNEWLLYVSDPEPMSVAVFRITAETIANAAYQIQQMPNPRDQKPLTIDDSEALFHWLLAQKSVPVEIVESSGMPSLFPPGKFAGARPGLNMMTPQIEK